jgi:hypothetical protein
MIRKAYLLIALLTCIVLNLHSAWADEDPAKQADVTLKVTSQLKDNKLVFTANNDLFGDPSSGDTKAVRIVYLDGTKVITRLFVEGADVSIAPSAGNTLAVKKAVYGVLEGVLDVTAKVVAAVQDNSLNITADNDTLGYDPAVGTVKQLTVNYTIDGVAKTATANEGDSLTVAKPDGGKKLVIVEATYGAPPETPPTATTTPAALGQ